MNPTPKPSLDRRLSAYVGMTAAAAGTFAATDAEGVILNSGLQNFSVAQGSAAFIDLDFDGYFGTYGLGEFRVRNYVFSGNNYLALDKAVGDAGSFVSFLGPNFYGYATALSAGDLIDATTTTANNSGPFATLGFEANPTFGDPDFVGATGAPATNFVGLEFTSEVFGGQLFGWVEIESGLADGTLTIVEWAFETDGTGILAGDKGTGQIIPEPSALGLLAGGAAGLAAFRRKRKAA